MSAEVVIIPVAPTFTVATAKNPVLASVTMPSLFGVVDKTTMSGTGVAEAEKNSVLIPDRIDAGKVLAQSKLN